MAVTTTCGEPYELAGNRLVFTNWHYVQQGQFSWRNNEGTDVTVTGSSGPWDAHFQQRDIPHGIYLKAQKAQRCGPLLQPERPWEGNGVGISTMIQENGIYRAWGKGASSSPMTYTCLYCYFESTDGMTWTRPVVNLYKFQGSRANNILSAEGGGVFYDPVAPPEERYKAIAEARFSREEFEAYCQRRPGDFDPKALRVDIKNGNNIMGVRGWTSPDGLRWSVIDEPLVVMHSDTHIIAYYDTVIQKYVAYFRDWAVGQRSPRALGEDSMAWLRSGRRAIGRSESKDFRNLSLSEVILEPGPELEPSDLLYTNCRTTIPGAPDHHLLFPAVWHIHDDTTSIALASSHDGKVWHFVPGSPVFDTAPFGEWDGGCVFSAPNLVELPDGSFALPYTGCLFPHKYPRGQWRNTSGYAVWPKGRLVALEAPDRGEFATVGIMPPGRRLRINALTKRAGGIRIEVAGMDRKPLPGRAFADAAPIIGDHRSALVVWGGQEDLGHPEGAAIILRFRIEKAQIFGLEFA